MGQKVNPHGLRVGVIKDWDSRWSVSYTHLHWCACPGAARWQPWLCWVAGLCWCMVRRAWYIRCLLYTSEEGIAAGARVEVVYDGSLDGKGEKRPDIYRVSAAQAQAIAPVYTGSTKSVCRTLKNNYICRADRVIY